MNATSLLIILVGIFILLNAPNFVAVAQGKATFGFPGGNKYTPPTTGGSGTGATGPTRVGGTGGT